jgi:regulator of nonsense transcripts 2
MKTQQQAEREEQQRIKNLVLNYDLRENEDQDGEDKLTPLTPNTNIHNVASPGHEKSSFHHNRSDNKSGKERSVQRVRKLQLSDVDWYDRSHNGNAPKDLHSEAVSKSLIPSGSRGRNISAGHIIQAERHETQPEASPVDKSMTSRRRMYSSSAYSRGRPRAQRGAKIF